MTEMERKHCHRRLITLDGFARADGLLEVEAELIDTKTYGFPSVDRGYVEAGEPVHHMRVRIAVDDSFEIREAKAETLAGPFRVCPDATAVFDRLVGSRIAPGWRARVRAAIGGNEGCTHITELMGPVATVVMQTFYGESARKKRERDDSSAVDADDSSLAGLVNSCIGYHEDGEAVRRLKASEPTD